MLPNAFMRGEKAHDELGRHAIPPDEAPLQACRIAIEWTNGVMNTLLAIVREISSRSDYYQQPSSNDRISSDHLFELIQSSIQEIVAR
jgi:hypothetical protein